MVWKIDFKETAKKQLKKIDKKWQKQILNYLDEVANLDSPCNRGKPLKGQKKDFWRYRIGDYRVICDIQSSNLVVLVLVVGHRKHVYDD